MADFSGLLAKAKGPPMAMPMMEEEAEADPKLDRVLPVAEDLIAALKSGDATAVAEALIASHEACAGYMGGEGEE